MQEWKSSSAVQDCGSFPAEESATVDGAFRLLRLADLAEELEAELVAEEARELAARVAEGRFYVCKTLLCWCREGGSNPHDRKGRRILSPLRLPVPPSRRLGRGRG